MSDLRHRRPNARIEALLSAPIFDPEWLDAPAQPDLSALPEEDPLDLMLEAADSDVDDVTVSSWGNLTPRMKNEPIP